MKTLIVQMSDMHCKSGDEKLTTKIDKAICVLKSSFGEIKKVILVYSGDLADQADTNEYKAGRSLLGKFVAELAR